MKKNFSAIIDDFVKETPERAEAVIKESTQDLSEAMNRSRSKGGRMRVETGFLRASQTASVGSMPKINPNAKPAGNGAFSENPSQITFTITGWDLKRSLYIGYTAAYAAHRELGANGQPGDHFVLGAAQRWQEFIDNNTRRLKDRS